MIKEKLRKNVNIYLNDEIYEEVLKNLDRYYFTTIQSYIRMALKKQLEIDDKISIDKGN